MEEELEETAGDQDESKRYAHLAPFQYKKGQSGNPSGRPHGISMKEYIRVKFRTMTDEEREEYLNGIPKLDLMKMAEGAPDTKNDHTTNGKDMPSPILGSVTTNEIPGNYSGK